MSVQDACLLIFLQDPTGGQVQCYLFSGKIR